MVYVHLAEGFEEIEALTVVDLLRRANIAVETVSIGAGTVAGAHGISVVADITIDKADYDNCEMIVLPGGMPGSVNLEECDVLQEQIDRFNAQGKFIAAICAAPMILGHKGLLDGKKAVIYDGMESDLGKAIVANDKAVIDGNFVTGKGPGCAIEFALKIISILKDEKAADMIKAELLY